MDAKTRAGKARQYAPIVDEYAFALWEAAAEDEQLHEIIRLARVGAWAESNCVAIEDALSMAITRLPNSEVSRFEQALDSRFKGSQ